MAAIVEFMKRSRYAYYLGDCCELRRALAGLGAENLPTAENFEKHARGLVPNLLDVGIEATFFPFKNKPVLLHRIGGEGAAARPTRRAKTKAKPKRRRRRKRGFTC